MLLVHTERPKKIRPLFCFAYSIVSTVVIQYRKYIGGAKSEQKEWSIHIHPR